MLVLPILGHLISQQIFIGIMKCSLHLVCKNKTLIYEESFAEQIYGHKKTKENPLTQSYIYTLPYLICTPGFV